MELRICVKLVVGILFIFSTFCNCDKPQPLLLVVSFDGFAPSYLNRNITPNLNRWRLEGTHAPYLRNVFPTKTFPNHHSIATGLYADEHGVMAAEFYDLELGKLEYGAQMYEYQEEITPIWTWNQMNGGKSGCMMWPGTNFKYSSKRIECTFIELLNATHPGPWNERIDTAIKWFKEGANLVMLYVEEPDHNGHLHGVGDAQNKVLQELDAFLGKLEEDMKNANLWENTNIILLSDHGMTNTTPTKFINITQYLPMNKEKIYGNSPVLQISPTTAEVDDIYERLLNASVKLKTFKVYRNKDLPKRWHYRNDRRTGPITVVAELGYAFQDMWNTIKEYNKTNNIPITNTSTYGIHGYDNKLSVMNSMFIARGPLIKSRHRVSPFDTVDLFHLFCEILQIKPPVISGNRDNILDVLVDADNGQPTILSNLVFMIIISAFLAVILVAGILSVLLAIHRRRNNQTVPDFIYDEPDENCSEEQKLLEISIPKFDSDA